ncbi:MAG: CaiB/BaiF CoA-transferase family protein [Tissierellia bacterium]|nr:CaiB/BaiF CoA-transferase family protein [Tissierellia bacterium]
MLPLQGIKVLDMTRVLSGPFSSMILSDFGADVVKIEAPNGGDDTRAYPPFQNDQSAYFMSINRNKKSVTVDTRKPEGVALVKELVPHFDVIIENFKPGTMDKIGLGYEVLKEINPKLIYVAISGYGHSGPWSTRPAYDAIVQAAGGIMSITGKEPGDYTRVGASIGDITAGLFATIGALLAILERIHTGKGDKVDVAMLDSQVAILENAIARYYVNGEIPQPRGNRHASITPFDDFQCQDGEKVMIAIGNDRLWAKFAKVAQHEELIDHEKYNTNPKRTENYGELRPLLETIFKEHDAQWWYDHLVAANVPITFINTIDRVVENEQIKARNMIVTANKEGVGPFKLADTPIKMDNVEGGFKTPAPFLGEDTDTILQEILGKTTQELQELREKEII